MTYGGSDGVTHESNISGDFTSDGSIDISAAFDVDALRAVSIAQGNYWDADRLSSEDLETDGPSDFYYDGTTPAIVFIDTDLTLSGSNNVTGFFVVNGNMVLNGTVQVDGGAFAVGNYTQNGGGSVQNIDGAVIAGGSVSMNGGRIITYNADRMGNVENLLSSMGGTYEMTNWEEL